MDPRYQVIPFQSDHATGVLEVVQAVYREYGFTWEAAGYHRDLYDIERYYGGDAGRFWTAVNEDAVVGCVGVTLHGEECELHRLYLLSACRGLGLGRRLLEAAIGYGRSRGCGRMIAWSDVKLTHAHRLYARMGFERNGERICDDPDQSREYGFVKVPL